MVVFLNSEHFVIVDNELNSTHVGVVLRPRRMEGIPLYIHEESVAAALPVKQKEIEN